MASPACTPALINPPHYTARTSNLNVMPLSGTDVHNSHEQKERQKQPGSSVKNYTRNVTSEILAPYAGGKV